MSNLRYFLLLLIASSVFGLACGQSQSVANKDFASFDSNPDGYPFSVREPEKYSCQVVQIAGDITNTIFLARSGDKWRMDVKYGSEDQVSRVRNGSEFLINYKSKSYAEVSPGNGTVTPPGSIDMLFRGMVGGDSKAKFEKVSTDAGITKFQVKYSKDTTSEVFIYIDDAKGMPVKQEFFAVEGDAKRNVMTVEVRDLKLEAPDDLFAIPSGFSNAKTPN